MLATLLLIPSHLFAQASTFGTIVGSISDPTGASVPDATIRVTNQTTGIVRESKSAADGSFAVFSLNPGTYTVEVTAPNFQTQRQENLKLDVARTTTLTFQLSVGQVAEVVDVQAAAPLLQTQDGTIGTVVENKEVVELPLNGRNFNQLQKLIPGATRGTNAAALTIQGETYAVTGSRSDNAYYSLDGMYNNGTFFKTAAIHPSIDAIQEFKVQTNTSARYGAAAGANINVALKSGSNEIHGAAYEFLRNAKLDSRDYFNPQKPPFKHNQFGFAVGGPVIKNKTFWFVNYEGFRERRGSTLFATVPTPAMMSGDLSKTLTGTAAPAIYDPVTGRDVNGQIVRDPFPGNVIPANRIQKYAQVHANLWFPQNLIPNQQNNFINTEGRRRNDNQFNTRIDHQISASNTLFGRFSWSNLQENSPSSLPNAYQANLNRYIGFVVNDTHIFSPTTILNLKAGYLRNNLRQGPAGRFNQAYRDAGLNNLPQDFVGFDYPVNLQIAGYSAPNVGNLINGPDFVYQGSINLTKVLGKHTFSAGYDYTRLTIFHDSVFSSFAHDNVGTADLQNISNTGNPVASFLLGVASTANRIAGEADLHIRHDLHHGYIQDDIKVNSKLTVNLGLRYEYNQWPHHIRGRLAGFDTITGQFIFAKDNPITGQKANVRPSIADPDWNNWAPRVGFAYRLFEKTVIRSAYGIFYNSNFSWEWSDSRGNWPFSVSNNETNLNRVPGNQIQYNQDLFQSFDPAQVKPQAQHTLSRDMRTPYMQNWNFGIEHQLAQDLLLELNYQGSKGTHLSSFLSTNDAFPGPGPVDPRRPWPINGSFSEAKNIATSRYNALTAKLEKRYAKGLSFLVTYAFQKSMDLNSEFGGTSPQRQRDCIRCDIGLSGFQQAHVGSFAGVWEIPVGDSLTGAARKLIHGWQLSGIATLESGRPFNLTVPFDNANVGSRGNFQRPNLVGNPFPSGFSQGFGPGQVFFDPSAFAVPAQYTFGNLGRNVLIGPAFNNLDLGVMKFFPITERFRLQFRSEFFNILNNSNFSNPGGNITTPSFGQITSTVTRQRQIQFGLKLLF